MTAVEHPRIRREGRTDLSTAIPLDTPIHVFIDPSAACNFKCGFCFHANPKNKHHEIMSWDTFTKTVDQLQQFPHKLKAVRLYGFGEPLLNKRLPEMVAYIKKAGVTDFVEFTTNGWWLSYGTSDRLLAAGLDAITISVPGLSERQIRANCGKDVNFREYVVNLLYFYMARGDMESKCRIHIKITNAGLTRDDIALFHRIFDDICDEISIDNVVPIWPGIEGELVEEKSIYRGEIKAVDVCPYIFYHLTIHANGDVSTCFVDFEHKNLLGNVNDVNLVDIWNGGKLRNLRINHLKGIKEGICKDCPQLIYGEPDDLDAYRDEILKRL